MRAMASDGERRAALVEVKAVEPSWPRSAQAVFEPRDGAGAGAGANATDRFGAAVEEALLARLDLKVGDTFRIGEARFEIRAELIPRAGPPGGRRSASARACSFRKRRCDATELVQPGSLVRWTTRVRHDGAGGRRPTRPPSRRFLDEAKAAFPEAGLGSALAINVSPDFSRDLDRFAEFLDARRACCRWSSAASASPTRRKASSNASARRWRSSRRSGRAAASVVALALVEFLVVGADRGRSSGLAIGAATPFAVDWLLFAAVLPIPLAPSIDPSALGARRALRLLTALAFAVAPLGRAHDIPVSPAVPRSRRDAIGRGRALAISPPRRSAARRSPARRSSPARSGRWRSSSWSRRRSPSSALRARRARRDGAGAPGAARRASVAWRMAIANLTGPAR